MSDQTMRFIVYEWIVITLGILLILLSGCCSEKEYYENGQIKRDYNGALPWSPNKTIELHGSAVGV